MKKIQLRMVIHISETEMILALSGWALFSSEVTDVASQVFMVQQPVVKAGGTAYIKGGCEQQKRSSRQ